METHGSLTVSRMDGEEIHVFGPCVIKVNRCSRANRLSFTITAARETRILRGEHVAIEAHRDHLREDPA